MRKHVQRQFYSLLSSRRAMILCLVAVVITLNSALEFGESLVEWSQSTYLSNFQQFKDNVGGESYQDRLCLPVPIDIVYTWVNGSDPRLKAGTTIQIQFRRSSFHSFIHFSLSFSLSVSLSQWITVHDGVGFLMGGAELQRYKAIFEAEEIVAGRMTAAPSATSSTSSSSSSSSSSSTMGSHDGAASGRSPFSLRRSRRSDDDDEGEGEEAELREMAARLDTVATRQPEGWSLSDLTRGLRTLLMRSREIDAVAKRKGRSLASADTPPADGSATQQPPVPSPSLQDATNGTTSTQGNATSFPTEEAPGTVENQDHFSASRFYGLSSLPLPHVTPCLFPPPEADLALSFVQYR